MRISKIGMVYNSCLLSLIIFGGCNHVVERNKGDNKQTNIGIRKCVPKSDTSIGRVKVNYIDIGNYYTLRITIDSSCLVLPYKFDCTTPVSLVPVYYSSYAGNLCLLNGYGQDMRKFIILYIDNGKIVEKDYETALVADLSKNTVIYKEYQEPNRIVIEQFRSGKNQKLQLPSDLKYEYIAQTTIKGDSVVIEFRNGRKFNIRY